MSHEATHWLAKIDPTSLNSGEFRVLFYLCDCHNPVEGCFPSQSYLIRRTGLSNGALNNNLKSLETKGLISRKKRSDGNGRRASTWYVLAIEDHPQSPEVGDGTNSSFGAKPSPVLDKSHLQLAGDKPVKGTSKGTGKEQGDQSAVSFSDDWQPSEDDRRWAWREGFQDEDIDHETKLCRLQYLGKHRGKTSIKWRQWMLRAKEFRRREEAATKARNLKDDPVMRRVARRYGGVS